MRRNTWFSLLHLVGWYIAVLVPALLLGRPGSECLPFYPALGTLTARPLFGGAPGIYSLSQHSFIAPTGIALYIVFALLLVWRMSRKSLASDRRRQLTALSLASLCAVAFLPWMCADSLYGAEVLLVALCCLEPKVIPAAVCASFASALALLKDVYGSAVFLPARLGKPRAPRHHGRSSAVSGFEEKGSQEGRLINWGRQLQRRYSPPQNDRKVLLDSTRRCGI